MLLTKFDLKISDKLEGNSGDSLVLNKHFSPLRDHIAKNLDWTNPNDEKYKRRKNRTLLKRCREHASDFSRRIKSEEVIILTHPFYAHLCNMNDVNSDSIEEAERYLSNIKNLLEARRDRDVTGVVAFETAQHYAAATSLMLERGLIDKVVFTEYDRGFPLKDRDVKPLKGKRAFLAGGYNTRCLRHAIHTMNEVASSRNVYVIRGAVMNPPYEKNPIIADKIPGVGNKIVELEDVLKNLREGSQLSRIVSPV